MTEGCKKEKNKKNHRRNRITNRGGGEGRYAMHCSRIEPFSWKSGHSKGVFWREKLKGRRRQGRIEGGGRKTIVETKTKKEPVDLRSGYEDFWFQRTGGF